MSISDKSIFPLEELREYIASIAGACATQTVGSIQSVIASDVTEVGCSVDLLTSEPIRQEELPILEELLRLRLTDVHWLEQQFDPFTAQFVVQYCCPEAISLLSVSGLQGGQSTGHAQRIHLSVWPSTEDAKAYEASRESAIALDHRRLGTDLDLFSLSGAIGPGLPLWHPNGAMLVRLVEEFLKQQHELREYDFVQSPHIGMADLWRTSGHLDWYQDGMFPGLEIDKRSYFLKPMNCPFHCLIFKSQHRSYRELPLRFAEWGTVYRYEPSGTLHGLMRVRGFTQDDAHIFCSPETIEEEVAQVIRFVSDILRHFGLNDIQAYVSTRNPEKFIGDPKEWGLPTQTLASALAQVGIPFQYDEGEAAFYGPKIDIKAKDRLGRTWQLSTIQFDFNLPRRFDLTYIGPDGKEHYPYLIHRALLGSLERFLGILIEHFGGAFPIWLAPKQVAIVPVKESHIDYAKQVHQALVAQRCRSFVDVRPKGMGQKVRDAKKSKIPFIAVVGDKEIENATVSVQSRDEQGKPMAVPVSRLVQMLKV